MPKQSYSLDPGGPKRLEISWKGYFKETTLTLDGVLIGTIPDQRSLIAGQDYRLMDGSILHAQLVNKLSGSELQIMRNGIPLPGSVSNPQTRVKTAAGILFFIAGLNLLLGFIMLFVKSDLLQTIGISWFNLIFGAFFLVMAFLVKRLSVVALILSTVVFALDGVLGIIFAIMGGFTPSIGGLVMRIFLIIPLIQGVSAINTLKKPDTPPAIPNL